MKSYIGHTAIAIIAGGLLAGCATTNNANTDVATWAGAFTCAVTDTLLAVVFPDMRFTAPGTTAALVAWPLVYAGPEGAD